jgi:peptide/nickel transport system ATP-binding protein
MSAANAVPERVELALPVMPALPVRLAVEDLRVNLSGSDTDVVDEVSFEVQAGEVLGLVGESGSGKTTVALALLGYTRRGLHLVGGSVRLDGIELVGAEPRSLKALRGAKVAYIPQDPTSALNPALRLGTQLNQVLRSHPRKTTGRRSLEERLNEILVAVGLGEMRDRVLTSFPHQLSGGQLQRAAIAMAFLCEPGLIVLDEPATGLDVTTQAHVLHTVRRLCETSGVGAVYVSHDLAVVSELATKVAVMYAGRLVEFGPTAKVFGSPAHPYTKRLLAAVPSTKRAEVLLGIEGQPPRPSRRPRGCTFALRCPLVMQSCTEAPPPVLVLEGGDHLVRCLRPESPLSSKRPQILTRAITTRAVDQPLLSISSLSARYGNAPVLRDVDMAVASERCVAVVGESGSGKTTLARCIVGLHHAWTGCIELRGVELPAGTRGRPKDALRGLQYVFQNPYTSLNPRKTIGQLVEQPLAYLFSLSRAERDQRVSEVLRDVSLGPDFLTRYPDQLSGGERQRVAIARALVVEPDLLVCDEVTAALDVSVQATIVELLRRLQAERGLAMVFITHNLALVRSIAQDVVVLSNGEVVEAGPVDDVLERPQNAYTIRLMENAPTLPDEFEWATYKNHDEI